MPLELPDIDDRSYEEILEESLARIPVHNPEWTNFNDSDPGVTILQVFAFMAESLLYRANLIPERNRLKFLQLLGIPVRPATPARGIVEFSNPRGPLQPVTIQPETEVLAGSVPFRTINGLDILPVEAKAYYKARPTLTSEEEAETEAIYSQLYSSHQEPGVEFSFYRTILLETAAPGVRGAIDLNEKSVDGHLWMALMAREIDSVEAARSAIAHKTLTIALVPDMAAVVRALPPGGELTSEDAAELLFEFPVVESPSEDEEARYAAADTRLTGNLMEEPSIVELQLPGESGLLTWRDQDPLEPGVGAFPPSLEDEADEDRIITWIRIRLGAGEDGAVPTTSFKVAHSGINGALVRQRARVTSEVIGQGSGEPDQRFTVANTPVIADSVRLTVQTEEWTRIDDVRAAPPEASSTVSAAGEATSTSSRVYSLDPESGEIRFGDGLRGSRPPRGSIIQVSYQYGGGKEGMVGAGSISKGPSLAPGVKVLNPISTWGGDAAESTRDAERRIPQIIRHRDRLVSREDFAEITRRTPGIEIGRVEVLPQFHPEVPELNSPGVVTLMVIPAFDPVAPDAPGPDSLFLDTICRYLNPRRLVTTELFVHGPVYKPVVVSIGIDVVPGFDTGPVREAVKQRIKAFLSPFHGGFDGAGWPLNHDVNDLELVAAAARTDGVARITSILLGGSTGAASSTISIDGLELPRLDRLAVQSGTARSLDDVRGGPVDGEPPPKRIVPIPIIPSEC